MQAPTHPVYGLRLCANAREGHESVFMIRTVKDASAPGDSPQVEIPLHIKIVHADPEAVGRAVIELLDLKPETGR